MLWEQGTLLRVFTGEEHQWEGIPLYQWIVQEAHRQGIQGATALRGMEGFGSTGRVHTARLLTLSADLPVVVEIVDSSEKIDKFVGSIEAATAGRLMTKEKISMGHSRSAETGGQVSV